VLIRTAKELVASMLDDAGVNPYALTTADVRTAVETFRRFAASRVEDAALSAEDGDAFLAQFGTYDLRGRREFSADLTRQLTEVNGEDASMWQLSCTLYWAPCAATDVLGSGHLWSFGKALDEFFAQAVALPGWAWALGGTQTPTDLAITLDEI
jgi:hypothetical protein